MILALVLAAWLFVLLVVVAVCVAAGRADGRAGSPAPEPAWPRAPRLRDWESAEHLAVYAHAAGGAQIRPRRAEAGSKLAGASGLSG